MTAKPKQDDALSTLLIARWEEIGGKLLKLAAEFPEKQFEHQPVENARTIGAVLRHVAFWNRYVADTLRGKPANDTDNELPIEEYRTKSRMIQALEQSSEQTAAALKEAALDPKSAGLAMAFIEHNCEHYGQLVVYSRLLKIVPPASRGV